MKKFSRGATHPAEQEEEGGERSGRLFHSGDLFFQPTQPQLKNFLGKSGRGNFFLKNILL
jgi:hypothetical protein